MKFWQYLLYSEEARKKLKHEIEYERKDKELKHNIAESNWKGEKHRHEKLYQRIFSAVLFLSGLALLMSASKEMGFFLMGAGVYGLVPENDQQDQSGLVPENDQQDQSKSDVNILKERWFWTLIVSLMMIVVIIISIIKIEPSVDTKSVAPDIACWCCGYEDCCCYEACCCAETKSAAAETKSKDSKIGKLLWLLLGILTMLFITESKRVINSRT